MNAVFLLLAASRLVLVGDSTLQVRPDFFRGKLANLSFTLR